MPLIGLSLEFQNTVRKFSVQETLLTFGRESSLIEEEGGIDLNPDKKNFTSAWKDLMKKLPHVHDAEKVTLNFKHGQEIEAFVLRQINKS